MVDYSLGDKLWDDLCEHIRNVAGERGIIVDGEMILLIKEFWHIVDKPAELETLLDVKRLAVIEEEEKEHKKAETEIKRLKDEIKGRQDNARRKKA